MSTTIVGTITSTYTLIDPSTSVDSKAGVSVTSGTAIIGPAGTAWNLTNAGMVMGSTGVALNSGGSVTDTSTGVISGSNDGVDISGASGTLENSGSIAGSAGNAAYLAAGGTITNHVGGTLSGYSIGVKISDGDATVINNGLITASAGGGVFLQSKGASGSIYVANTGSIIGSSSGLRTAYTGVETLINSGLIQGTSGNGVSIYSPGGMLTNTATGRIEGDGAGNYGVYIAGGATMLNQGAVAAPSGNGVVVSYGASLTNASGGTIAGGTSAGNGVVMYYGRAISNAASATISGYTGISASSSGFYGGYSSASISNAGAIVGSAGAQGAGIAIGGGIVVNSASGTISGGDGVFSAKPTPPPPLSPLQTTLSVQRPISSASTVAVGNAGTIEGSYADAVYLKHGGIVVNVAGGLIQGVVHGVSIRYGAGTVVNAGAIQGGTTVGQAVLLSAGYANRVIVDPGAVFVGGVDGGNAVGSTIVSTLELGSAVSSGTLSGVGSQFVNFGSIVFDTGAQWTLAGNSTGLASGESISGFAAGDTIELTGLNETIQSYADGTLSLGGNASLALDMSGSFTADSFIASQVAGGTDITLSCFVTGTRIRGEFGDIAVERLRAGDRVMTESGALRPIKWIGHRTIDCRNHPRPQEVWPVRIMAGAFGPALPARDLKLSPDHAVWSDGVLIPTRYLVNGTTIAQQKVRSVTYYHIELERHDLLLAEGLAAESYLDTGDRANFANGGTTVRLFPNFADEARNVSLAWEARGYARLVVAGPELQAARARIGAQTAAVLAQVSQAGKRIATSG